MTQTNPVSPPTGRPEPSWADVLAYPLACIGALIGAAAGAFVTKFAAQSGFYAIIVVGILTGLGAILISRRGNWGIAIIAGVIALAASLWTEWWLYPFVVDDSLGYFVQHIGDLPPFRLLIHVAGAGCAAYIGLRK